MAQSKTISRPLGALIRLMLVIGLSASATTAIAAVPDSANAEEASYSCSECESKAGPEQVVINRTKGHNYSGTGVCSTLWENEGNGNYARLEFKCNATGQEVYTQGIACIEGGKKHGDVKSYYSYLYHLSGHQFFETIIC